MFNNPTVSQVPAVGRIAKLKSNGACFTIAAVSDDTLTLYAAGAPRTRIYRDTLTMRDFAIRYEIVR